MGCSALRGKSFVPHNSPVLTSSDFRIILNSFLKLEEEEQIKIALLDASHTHTQTHTFAQQHLRPFLSPLLLSPPTARFARFARFWRVLRVLRVLRFKSKNIVANGFDSSPKPGKGVWPRSWKCNSTCDELYSIVY